MRVYTCTEYYFEIHSRARPTGKIVKEGPITSAEHEEHICFLLGGKNN